jgi:hypothetical protein|tara:strand:- start:77 stop:376 length:300 start_codon:yes stop_codon:yes gene_type:complete
MKTNVDLFAFRDEMTRDRYSFSWEGATALYDYFMDLEEDTGKEMEFDPIAISCDFSEYENLQEVLEGCSIDYVKNMKDLRDQTQVIEVSGTQRIIIQEF